MSTHTLSPSKLSFSAIIFDMDGLVIDTEPGYFFAWQQALTQMGYLYSDDFCCTLSGLHYQDVIRRIRTFAGKGFDLTYFNQLAAQHWQQFVSERGLLVNKGFFDLLDRLKACNTPFCLATNSRKENALTCLEFAQLKDVFPIIITLDEVRAGKPAPDIFLLAASRLEQPPSQCLVLEDSSAGIQAATKAGCPSILIPSSFPVNPVIAKLANYCFGDLTQVIQLL